MKKLLAGAAMALFMLGNAQETKPAKKECCKDKKECTAKDKKACKEKKDCKDHKSCDTTKKAA